MSFFCAYCGQDKPESTATQEHVFPDALGGKVQPTNPFTMDVCGGCNTTCGNYVDGSFLRSWLFGIDRFSHAQRYVDLARNPIASLFFAGENAEFQWEDKICDYWTGPAGAMVLHFHQRYPGTEDVRTEVGRPLGVRTRDIDPGFVVVVITNTNPVWWNCIFQSVSAAKQFKDAALYVANASEPPTVSSRYAAVPAKLTPLVDRLLATEGHVFANRIAMDPHAGERFLAKLALGFGSLYLDPSFRTSEDAERLRAYMWQKDPASREAMRIRGTTFWHHFFHGDQERINLNRLLGWRPGHVILIQEFENLAVSLSVMLYGSQHATIVMSSTPAHWAGRIPGSSNPRALVFIVAPVFQRAIGPVPLTHYTGARDALQRGRVINDIGALIQEVESLPEPPPFDLENPSTSSLG